MKNVPQWRMELFKTLAEDMLSELSDMTEGQLRSLRGELGRFEAVHNFEHESSRDAIKLFINVIGALLFRY